MSRALFSPVFARRFGNGWLLLGYVFLYLPILSLIVYSFNASSVPTQWGGVSLVWYVKLLSDSELLGGLWLSAKIALVTAIGSVLLGGLAAYALVKYRRFRGRTVFTGMVSAPLVMPEVIIGLSLLLMLVSVQRATAGLIGDGIPERGIVTICLGHLLLGMAYAAVVIQARLAALNPALEEAAMDLGARPSQVFRLVTLPLIVQSLASAALLTFSLSLDDVVVSAFLSGPGATTLPLVIFSRARLGLNPSVNAIATVIIVVVGICVALASWFIARNERRRATELRDAGAAG